MITFRTPFFVKAKGILWQLPPVRSLYEICTSRVAAHELSGLINENRMAVLHPYHKQRRDDLAAHETAHDVVKDLLNVYHTLTLESVKASSPGLSAGVVLLRYPLALLRITSTHEEYLKTVGDKTRNMIRKAERQGYEVRELVWNNYLEDIFDINTSKDVRQSEEMHDWYREPVKPRFHAHEQYYRYYGVFKEGRLYAYAHLVLCGDFAFFRHFLGHAEHLKYGIMNALISGIVREYVGSPQITWLKYGTLHYQSRGSMESFRKHAGFKGYATFLDLADDQELLLLSQRAGARFW